MALLVYIAVYSVLSTAGVLLLRASVDDLGGLSLGAVAHAARSPAFLVGFACYAASFLTWLAALRLHEVTRIFPAFAGAGYCAVVVGAALFLGEELSLSRAAGIAVILAGILLVLR